MDAHPSAVAPPERRLSVPVAIGLALLAVPRVMLHDLGVVDGPVVWLLTFLPPVVWVAYAVHRRLTKPLLALAAVGLGYGVLLAATHQLLWHEAFEDGEEPRLGGELEGELPAWLETALLRGAAVVSSVVVGVVVGLLAGLVAAWLLRRRGDDRGAGRTGPAAGTTAGAPPTPANPPAGAPHPMRSTEVGARSTRSWQGGPGPAA